MENKTRAEIARKVAEIVEQLEKEGYHPGEVFDMGKYLTCGR